MHQRSKCNIINTNPNYPELNNCNNILDNNVNDINNTTEVASSISTKTERINKVTNNRVYNQFPERCYEP